MGGRSCSFFLYAFYRNTEQKWKCQFFCLCFLIKLVASLSAALSVVEEQPGGDGGHTATSRAALGTFTFLSNMPIEGHLMYSWALHFCCYSD